MYQINYWVVVVRVRPPRCFVPRPGKCHPLGGEYREEYWDEIGAPYVADVAPALVRKVELGEFCVLPDWCIAEVIDWYPSAEAMKAAADELRSKHPELDIRELMTAESPKV